MPTRPGKPCAQPGCPAIVPAGAGHRCQAHLRQYERQQDRARGGSTARLYDSRWQRASKAFLAEDGNQFCRYCGQADRLTLATCVDHNPAHKGDPERFWDRSTWVPACIPCNSRRAVMEEGALGRGGS